ncbi:hypothetical protein KsCSTR_28450 [Candidatus Kuenenia stuttgartiensis]|uniref:Uncharacterized protein n=1 Tax=Kuenenia stuttgartiensis TaxID=174633 RepID=A0A6G7GS93_KUEST|nr:hypothetical protein KsCSTR_28450 [Candidatus Kuenenia stuttgartiensis]
MAFLRRSEIQRRKSQKSAPVRPALMAAEDKIVVTMSFHEVMSGKHNNDYIVCIKLQIQTVSVYIRSCLIF